MATQEEFLGGGKFKIISQKEFLGGGGFKVVEPEQKIAPIETEKPGFFGRLKERFGKSIETTKRAKEMEEASKITKLEEQVRAAGGAGKFIGETGFDIFVQGVKGLSKLSEKISGVEGAEEKSIEIAKDKMSDFLKTDSGKSVVEIAQTGGEIWQSFKQKFPRAAKNVEGVIGIAEVVPAFKAAQVAGRGVGTVKKTGREIVDVIAKPRKLGKIEETISPKLTLAEQRAAQAEGRIIRGKEGKIFGKRPDTVIQEQKVKNAAITIKEDIPNAEKMTDVELKKQIEDSITQKSTELKPILADVDINKDQLKLVRDEWENIKETQLKNPDFVAFAGGKQFQRNFEAFLNEFKKTTKDKTGKFRTKTLDDVWDIRKRYDKSIPERVKSADKTSAPSLQLQKEMWSDNRRILNDIMEEMSQGLEITSKEAFDKMSDLYLAQQNIINKTKIDVKGASGIFNLKNIIRAGAGAIGIKFLID